MKLLNLFLTVPQRAEPGEIQINAQGEAGQAVYPSRLPFFDDGHNVPDRWRTTMIKALGAVVFQSDTFPKSEEVNWMVAQGWLTPEGNYFDAEILKKIGQGIYNTLFPPGKGRDLLQRMLARLESNEQLHIQIQFSEEIDQRGRLPDYPWELACDDRGFLARRQVTFSRLIAFVENIPKLPAVKKIKVLLVSSPVGDSAMHLPPLDSQEQRAILRGLKQAEAEGKIEVEQLKSPTFKEFGDYLTQISGDKTPHIIHFDGHGVFGKRCNNEQCRTIHNQVRATQCRKCGSPLDPSPQGYLLFEPNPEDWNKDADYISATEISDLIQKSNLDLEQQPDQGIRLVVMSACKTGMALGSDSVFNGVAQKLIEQQIPAVVAMQYNVTVTGATAFAERFYRALGNKKVLTTALSMGQSAMGREGNQWYRPVLYLRWYDQEGGQLFVFEQLASPDHAVGINHEQPDQQTGCVRSSISKDMNLQEFIKNGILNQLAASFKEEEMAEFLLNSIDFPEHMRPIFPTGGRTLGYWQKICKEIQNGVLPTGNNLQPLVDAAMVLYPNNPIFNKYCSHDRDN
ncbi:CHAT domain-containing protein [Moorena sp. SIO4G3]|uniref:CHAT domain-containing protein n=1 Tax=Moorena sp. SIO4G3 TaxID=2607821 RepID=UPI00142C468B|nr:CHAT domain-containing protein [Moorena sp. SIO4G3]NEO75341.1 CHAT domain-containing protein [Moorena sp. SIO4G3]